MFRKLSFLATLALALLAFGCSDDDCPTCNGDGPVAQLNKHKIDFGATGTTATFTVSNKGTGSLGWDLSVGYRFLSAKQTTTAHGGWLEASTASGEGDATITLTVDRAELDELGVSRAVVTINFPDAVNMARDSVEVYIVNGGAWSINDDGTFEDCWEVDALDYYWVKGFEMPHGQEHVFVDSVAISFCEADTIIQLLAYDAYLDPEFHTYVPNNALAVSNFFFEVEQGWNTLPVDWYIPESPLFYVGYFQLGSGRPDLNIDYSTENDTLCWRARDISVEPGTSSLQWQWNVNFESFAIRVFLTPVLEYNPKMVALQSREGIENSLKTGHAYKGKYPMSVIPSMPR